MQCKAIKHWSGQIVGYRRITESEKQVPCTCGFLHGNPEICTKRFRICPNCQNEEFTEDAKFCRICGKELEL